ncbi:hypothetical protein E3V55_06350 [Candidatus Marinimicrobia bacterium MT.SAG.3]|nr:hypothetical protein E3V55_06350 [Candidatus Marinimicrobia bacterium MT.SAG.3]
MKASILILFVSLHQTAIPQVNRESESFAPLSEELALQGVREMYNFQFDESRESFEKFTALNPDHPAGYFYQVVLDWFTFRMFKEDKDIWGEMSDELDRVVIIAEGQLKMYPDDALSMVYLGAARGLKARIALSKNDFIDTFYDGYAGYSIIQEAMRIDPTMIDPKIGLGIFHYFIAISSPMIRSLSYIAGISSSKEKAIDEIAEVSERGIYASIEARSFLMFIYAYIEEEHVKALNLSRGLVKEFDQSPYFHGKLADILLLNGEIEEARQHLELIPKLVVGLPDKYQMEMKTRVKFLQGESLRREGKPEEALELFIGLADLYTLEFKFNLGYIYLRTGMAYDEIGERKEAKKQYKKAVKLDNYTSAVRLSKLYLKEAYVRDDAPK